MESDEEARRYVAEQLEREADAQERGDLDQVGTGVAALESYASRTPSASWSDPTLGAAYTFWDAWVDARNHEWRYYARMPDAASWPPVARRIAAALRAGEDPMPLVRDYVL